MKNLNILYFLLAIGLFVSCNDEEDIEPTESYLRILDDADYNAQYNPISIVETVGGGSIVLSGIDAQNSLFEGAKIIRLDSLGEYVSEFILNENFVAPLGDMMSIDSTHYFFCMEAGTLFVNLVTVDNDGVPSDPVRVGGGLRYPLASAVSSDGNLILLSYDPVNQLSVISLVATDGSLVTSAGYTIGAGDDVEPDILEHLIDPSIDLPFFVGEAGSSYYFNGFYNYILSLVFTNFGGDPTGVVQGQQTFSGIRTARHISGSEFAFLGFQYNNNFVQPLATLSLNGTTSSVDYFNRSIPEIRGQAPAKIIQMTRESGDVVTVVATESESRQAILYFYDATGMLIGTHYVGYLNPFTLADVIATTDNALVVMGTTFVASRFERIYVAKIPSKQIDEIIQ